MPTHVRQIIGHRRSVQADPVHINHVGAGWYNPQSETGENGSALLVYAEANPDDSVRVFVILGNTLFFTWRVAVGSKRVMDDTPMYDYQGKEYRPTGFARVVTGNREDALQEARRIADTIIERNRLVTRPDNVRAIRQTQQELALEAVAV